MGRSHAAIIALLKKHGLTDLTDHDAFFDLFYDEGLRFDYMLAFKKLTRCLNVVFPAQQALEYMDDYQALTEINVLAGKHFRDQRLSMKGIPPKLRAITDEHLESRGIDIKGSIESKWSNADWRKFGSPSDSWFLRRIRVGRRARCATGTSPGRTRRSCRA